MIVKKYWTTGVYYLITKKYWEGWFLFGIIPLYIRQIEERR